MSDNKGGRPTKYDPKLNGMVEALCRLGATDKELAETLGVTEQTINNWKNSNDEFFEAIKRGKILSDQEVSEKLFKKATGYDYVEEQAIKVKDYNIEGKQIERIEIIQVVKHVPPDSTAQFFWLKNRRKNEWRDKQEHEITGADGGPIEVKWQ